MKMRIASVQLEGIEHSNSTSTGRIYAFMKSKAYQKNIERNKFLLNSFFFQSINSTFIMY